MDNPRPRMLAHTREHLLGTLHYWKTIVIGGALGGVLAVVNVFVPAHETKNHSAPAVPYWVIAVVSVGGFVVAQFCASRKIMKQRDAAWEELEKLDETAIHDLVIKDMEGTYGLRAPDQDGKRRCFVNIIFVISNCSPYQIRSGVQKSSVVWANSTFVGINPEPAMSDVMPPNDVRAYTQSLELNEWVGMDEPFPIDKLLAGFAEIYIIFERVIRGKRFKVRYRFKFAWNNYLDGIKPYFEPVDEPLRYESGSETDLAELAASPLIPN